jgi:predicted RND superfamily exporter protein
LRTIVVKLSIIFSFVTLFSISGYFAQKSVPFQIDQLIEENAPLRLSYLKHQDNFDDENVILFALDSTELLTDKVVIEVGNSWRQFWNRSAGIKGIYELSTAEYLTYKNSTIKFRPFYKKGEMTTQGKSETTKDFYKNFFFSETQKSLVGTIRLINGLDSSKEKAIVSSILNFGTTLEKKYPFIKVHFLGPKVAKHHFLMEMFFNQMFISPFIFLLLSILVFWLFRSWRVVLWVDLIISLSYSLVMTLIFGLDGGLNPYSGLALTFVIIVSTSDLVHYFTSFYSESGPLDVKLKLAKEKLWTPCLLTTVTTSLSFLSLLFNDMKPVQHFGIYCSVGSVVAFYLTFYLLPWCLKSFPVVTDNRNVPKLELGAFLFSLVSKFRNLILISAFVVIVLLIGLSGSVDVDDDFYDKFKASHPLAKSLKFFSNEYSFVSSIDIVYDNKSINISEEVYNKIKAFEAAILKINNINHLSSYVTFREYLKSVSPVFVKESDEFIATRDFLASHNVLKKYTGKDGKKLKTTVFLSSTSMKRVNQVIKEIKDVSKSDLDISIEGFVTIRSFLYNKIVQNFISSFAFSFVVIFLVFLIIFRSFIWALIALIPNIFPLLLISGLMSSFQLKIEGNAVMMVCIVLGVAVDDTIHFLYRLRHNLDSNKGLHSGIATSYDETSKALIGTTLIFLISFPCLLLSDLRLMIQMGGFIVVSLTVALLADFVLLPAILLIKKD